METTIVYWGNVGKEEIIVALSFHFTKHKGGAAN